MDGIRVSELVERLGSNEDGVRKMAAFKLQSAIGDPSFTDAFISEGGLPKLRWLALNATGNTLAYSLTAFSRMLEVDQGWDYVDPGLVTRVVELVVTHPLVNILRGAMSILAAVVSHPASNAKLAQPETFGFRALKPAIADFPEFLEMLVNRLSSADHALCTNALQLINALMRDAITNGSDQEWPKFIKRLQDLGVIRAVYGLMQGSALQDLAQPLLEFQALTKILLRKWRDVPVDLERQEHRRALKGIHLASLAEGHLDEKSEDGKQKRHVPDWKKLGFHEEGPGEGFDEVGFLGMMDLADYVRKNESGFQRLLLEQSTQPKEKRCPVARASIAVTATLYEHFEIEKADMEDAKEYLALDSRDSIDKPFKPMLLQWSKLHTAGLQAFLRLWKTTGAEAEDFPKVSELVRILLEAVLGGTSRSKDVHSVEEEIQGFGYQRLRELQMELFELSYEDTWGQHLEHVRDELSQEAMQFIKEQRVRCLLEGAWFPTIQTMLKLEAGAKETQRNWGFVKLSHNRRYLHYAGFDAKGKEDPVLDDLPEKIDLTTVSSVVSNVNAAPASPSSSSSTLKTQDKPRPQSRISINGMLPIAGANGTENHQRGHHKNPSTSSAHRREAPLLTLHPESHGLAAEWLDGLLMLLNQAPITAETSKLLNVVGGWGLKIRLLNVRYDDGEDEDEDEESRGVVPSREGLDEDYYYEMFGT